MADNKKDNSKWTSANEATLVSTLKKAKDDGLQSENGWKTQVWQLVIEALRGSEVISGGAPKGVSQGKSRWQRLKSEYQLVRNLRGQSGFGWDGELQLVTATADVWDSLIKSNPKASPWRKKNFPLYEDMALLVDGIAPNGSNAFRPGREPTGGLLDEVLHPDLRDPEKNMSDNDEEVPMVLKRPAESTPEPQPKKKKGRQSGTTAIFSLSSSIESAVDAFNSSSEGPASQAILSSPQRKSAAIRAVEESEELSDNEMTTDIADAYLALGKKSTRTVYLNRALAKYGSSV
ncbi:hypothetical protein DFH11DRAFT_1779430 [Phellopilus nigrolimitatus]|nr:hypothetical protein DFH11DRAFT_1779430 [Phellopilus nigrolimitatus]